MKALVYFDEDKYENGTDYDWRLDATSASYAAWNDLINEPYLEHPRLTDSPGFGSGSTALRLQTRRSGLVAGRRYWS